MRRAVGEQDVDYPVAGRMDFDRNLVSVAPRGAGVDGDWRNLRSPETYLGQARSERYSSRDPGSLNLNQWTLVGDWTRNEDSSRLNKANGKVAYRFHARDVHLVMGSAARATPVRFRVRIDGQPPGPSHGMDVDEAGSGAIDGPKMYQLIRQTGPIAERLFEIEFLDPGAEIFAFTFG